MTTTPHGQVPEALIDLIDTYAETRHRCGGIYNAKTEAARKAVIEALSGVQALSAAPAGLLNAARMAMDALDWHATSDKTIPLWKRQQPALEALRAALAEQQAITPETGNSVSAQGAAITSESGAVYAELPELTSTEINDACWAFVGAMPHNLPGPFWNDLKPAVYAAICKFLQAAPKAAPGVGSSGFDHKTAADLLNNKTVSDEAVRKFVATSRWAHDEKAALSAMLLSVRGVLASREAEIALLKKALLEAEAAPQLEAQEPVYLARYKDGDWQDSCRERNEYLKNPQMSQSKDWELRVLYRTPQPAPAPLSDDVVQDAARFRDLYRMTALLETPAGNAYQEAMESEMVAAFKEADSDLAKISIEQYRRVIDVGFAAAALSAQGGE